MSASHVTILMCTYNGAAFLQEQIQSFAGQDTAHWSLIVSDDGSTDNTLEIIKNWCHQLPGRDVTIAQGPRRGSAANFLNLLAQTDTHHGYLAFSDQDDIWLPHKLSRAVEHLKEHDGPAIYSSRSFHLVPGRPLKASRRFNKPFQLGNALVQNVLSGHSIVMNPQAAHILRHSCHAALDQSVPFHDWWVYQLASAAGMTLLFDDTPGLNYRQHSENELGGNYGALAGLARLGTIASGEFTDWMDRNLAALRRCDALLTIENRAFLEDIGNWRASGYRKRFLRGPISMGLYRQSAFGMIALETAGRLGRL